MHKSFVSLALSFCVVASAAESNKPIKALLVCGGCCHDFANQKNILSEGISTRANVVFTVVHEGDDRTNRVSIYEKSNWWQGYDVVVHNECFGMVADDKFIENIAAAHKAGVPAVMLHCSTHSYRAGKTDAWRETLGITSFSHEKRRDLDVKTTSPAHPVMKGFPAEWHNPQDELYKNERVWPNVIPLAKAYGEETKEDHVVIWLNIVGKGTRVFATTLGHGNDTMKSDIYLDLVTRGLLWTCDKLGDDGKPKPGYAK
ncbi:MAG TPA: ThuA domain-containing protein [Candidatus Acidoferrum sp.]|nr:ThuA domain-containing protein [Candidatus Acidoferrum sp.]